MQLPPGPRTSALVQTLQFVTRPLPFFDRCHRDHGSTYTIKLIGVGHSVHVTTPDGVRELFTAPVDHVHAGDSNMIIEPLVGDSSVALVDEAAHARMRRALKSPLHGQRMRAHGASIVEATRCAIADFRPGEIRPMLKLMQDISLEVILRVIFGIRDRRDLPAAASCVMDMVNTFTPPLLVIPQLRRDLGPWSPGGRFLRRRRRMDDWLLGEISRRRTTPPEGRTDVLSTLLHARDEGGPILSDREIRDQLVTLFVAGQDTTSCALSWALALLTHNQQVMEKLVAELDGLGPDAGHEALAELPYLTAVCNESLRAVPTVFGAARMVTRQPFRLQGFEIPPGVYLSPNIYLVHKDPTIYPEPQRFRPERFLEREFSAYEFLPFGGGARRCLGMPLSFFEMRLVLGTLLQELRLQSEMPRLPRPVFRGMVMAPEQGGPLRITERRPQPRRFAKVA